MRSYGGGTLELIGRNYRREEFLLCSMMKPVSFLLEEGILETAMAFWILRMVIASRERVLRAIIFDVDNEQFYVEEAKAIARR